MSHRAPPSLLDQALAPATRLMARLRFGQKAMVIGAAFTVTCVVLGGMVIVNAATQLSDARLQRETVAPIARLHRSMQSMHLFRQLTVRKGAGDDVADAEIETAHSAASSDLATAKQWALANLPPSDALAASFDEAETAWQAAKGEHPDVASAAAARRAVCTDTVE